MRWQNLFGILEEELSLLRLLFIVYATGEGVPVELGAHIVPRKPTGPPSKLPGKLEVTEVTNREVKELGDWLSNWLINWIMDFIDRKVDL